MSRTSQSLGDAFSDPQYVRWTNLRNRLRGKKHRIDLTGEDGVYRIRDDSAQTLHICRRRRHSRSKNGIIAGVDKLAAEYNLDHVPAASDGLLIDCGANVGELGLWARARGWTYTAFEPETLEARCCDLNNYDGQAQTIRKGLWNETTELVFYSKPGSADGSLLEMDNPTGETRIDVVRLDEAVDLSAVAGTVVFKVEAEGAEPEVLAGATGLLDRIDYIAVDCGPERGLEKKHTFVETNQFLTAHGFEAVAAQFKRVTVLYRRKA